MKSWLVLIAVGLLGVGCDVGGGTLTGTGGGTISTGAGAVTGSGGIATGSGGIATGSGGSLVTGSGGDGLPPPNPCGTTYRVGPLPAEIMIVLDTSASMNDAFDGPCAGGCGAASKWMTARSIVESVVASETAVNWGLQLMTDFGANSCTAPAVAIPVGPTNATAIRSELSRRSSGGALVDPGNTPTRAAIQSAAAQLSTLTTAGRKAILLITDGAPDCSVGASDPFASDLPSAELAISYAAGAGFPTQIAGLGIAPEAEASLSEMALSGGLARAGTPRYFPVSSAADLGAAVSSLIATLGTCVYSIPQPSADGVTSPSRIDVFLDGSPVPRDSTHLNGWDYLDATFRSFQLYGAPCDAARAGGGVSVTFRCILI